MSSFLPLILDGYSDDVWAGNVTNKKKPTNG